MTTTRIQEHEVRVCPTHEIPGLPGWHHCASRHGHTYILTFILETEVPDGAVVADPPSDLAAVDAWARELDGRYLNDLIGKAATEEHIAIWAYELWKPRLPELGAVAITSGIDRTEHPRLEYRPGGARPNYFLIDESRRMKVPIGWDGEPIYPDDDVVVPQAADAK